MSIFTEWQHELNEIAEDMEESIIDGPQWRKRFDAGLTPLDAFYREFPQIEDDGK